MEFQGGKVRGGGGEVITINDLHHMIRDSSKGGVIASYTQNHQGMKVGNVG